MRKLLLSTAFVFFFFSCPIHAQLKLKGTENGMVSLGVRSTLSTFGHNGENGKGFGGQMRIRFAKRVNTEWFADYINNDVKNVAKRTDAHIGWSVLFYPGNTTQEKGRFVPYLLAGHCFDYTQFQAYEQHAHDNHTHDAGETPKKIDRWSSAVQAGAGIHYFISNRLDASFTTQYMSHLGNDIEVNTHQHSPNNPVAFKHKHGGSLEGHLLFTLSINIKLIDVW